MAERSCPAVRFPLHGAGVLPWVLSLWLLGGGVLLLAWLGCGGGVDEMLLWRSAAGLLIWVMGAWSARHVWRQVPQGALIWSGKCWQWQRGESVQMLDGGPQVICDLGRFLVLRWQGHRYFWLQRNWGPQAWQPLRRAVYLSVSFVQSSHEQGSLS